MKQLIDPNTVERVMLFLAIAGPLVGLIVGLLLGAHERCSWPKTVGGILFGMLGTVAYAMWRVHSLIIDVLGLDSLSGLGLQLMTFAALGVILGVASVKISGFVKRLGANIQP